MKEEGWTFSVDRIRRFRSLLLVVAAGLLLLPTLGTFTQSPPDTVFFLGRFHPLIIHFPIVLIGLVLLLEILAKTQWVPEVPLVRLLFLLLASLSSVVAVGLGYLLYATGDYGGDTAQLHLWAGVLVAVGTLLTTFLYLHTTHPGRLVALAVTNLVVLFASHQGGSLTHGEDYLTEYLPTLRSMEPATMKSPEELLVYDDMLVPILDSKCRSCHNENKTKGGLLMMSYDDLLRGGDSNQPVLVPGVPEESGLLQRVTLPETHEDHMPPDGKPGLDNPEISLLRAWIAYGANPDTHFAELAQDSVQSVALADYLRRFREEQQARVVAQQNLQTLVQTVSHPEVPYVIQEAVGYPGQVSLTMRFPPSAFTDAQLLELQPLLPHIARASFVSSDITDDALYPMGQMTNLHELYLQKTALDGSGLAYLTALPNLKLLDLSQTSITDASLLYLLDMPALREVYLYETTVSEAVVEAIRQHKPELKVHLERGSLF